MTTTDRHEKRLPTEAEEARFWRLLEEAWAHVEGADRARSTLARRSPADADADTHSREYLEVIDNGLGAMLDALTTSSQDLSAADLTDLDRVVERKLYDIDRGEIQAVTDGSDDGFLYARGFIVAMGRDFYDAVVRNPQMAILDGECEEICYFFAHLHDDRFSGYPKTASGISRESCTNQAGWA